MDNLIFNNITYKQINISDIPAEYKLEIDKIYPKEGECLNNSYLISKKINSIKMVEGFLVTYFDDESDIESVGHVWNESEGKYFDITIGLKKHNKKVKKQEYYLANSYQHKEISIETREKPSSMYDIFFKKPTLEKHMVFKTDVKKMEKGLKDFLNKKKNHNKANIKALINYQNSS